MSIPEDPKVIPIRPGKPLLSDIPGQLRNMAHLIETGQYKGNAGIFILVDQEREQENWPEIFGWGEALGDYQLVGILEIVKTWFVVNQTKRFT